MVEIIDPLGAPPGSELEKFLQKLWREIRESRKKWQNEVKERKAAKD